MRVNERYLISLTITLTLTTFTLSLYSTIGLDLYISAFIVEYFILTLLHAPLNPKIQKITNLTSYALFAVFLFIVAVKVLQIIGASSL